MVNYVSSHGYVLIGKETNWGTAVSATKDVGLIQNFTATDRNTITAIYAAGSAEPQAQVAGLFDTSGSIDVIYQHGRLLEYIFGSVTHQETNGDWKHTFTPSADLPSFTCEYGLDSTSDAVWKYAGCKLTSLTISLTPDTSLRMRADYIAKTVSTSTTASTKIISTLAPLPGFHGSVATGAEGSETTLGQVQSFDVTINFGQAAISPQLGSRLGGALLQGQRNYTFALTMLFSSLDEYGRFLAGSTSSTSPAETSTPTIPSIVIKADNGVDLGSGKRAFYIQLKNAVYHEASAPLVVGDYVIASFTGYATGLGTNGCYTVDNISSTNW